MRRDGKPDWMQVTGLVHDLGKLLFMFGSDGQWDVVGVSLLPSTSPIISYGRLVFIRRAFVRI